MKATIEMSLYPLTNEYTEIIVNFIKALNERDDLAIYTTAMSTYIVGEFGTIMDVLKTELIEVYTIIPDSSTVIKIIPKDLSVERGFLSF